MRLKGKELIAIMTVSLCLFLVALALTVAVGGNPRRTDLHVGFSPMLSIHHDLVRDRISVTHLSAAEALSTLALSFLLSWGILSAVQSGINRIRTNRRRTEPAPRHVPSKAAADGGL